MAIDRQPPHPPVRRLGIVLHPERELGDAIETVLTWAGERGVALTTAAGDDRLPASVARASDDELAAGCDVVLALGGDGTMLGAMRLSAPHDVPVLGVNLGTLGYLTEVESGHLPEALAALAAGEYRVQPRSGLALGPFGEAGAGERGREQIAYNDIVLTRVPGRGQAALGLRIDGELLVRYASDGVIVATPQGSTAYAFAAGGPLVSPLARGMIVMPDAPHGLFNRAVVLAETERLGIEVLARSAPVSIERDGRLLGHAESGTAVEIAVHPQAAGVVRLGPDGFADRARRKLGIADPAGFAETDLVAADYDLAGHER